MAISLMPTMQALIARGPELSFPQLLHGSSALLCPFRPIQIPNPGEVFPQLHRCAELGRLHVHSGQVPFPDLPRFQAPLSAPTEAAAPETSVTAGID